MNCRPLFQFHSTSWFPCLLAALILSLFLAMPLSSSAQSVAPTLIPFQGRLTNQTGIAYDNGQYTITFNLYNLAIGGTTIWTERHEKVSVIGGMVNLFLGSINNLAGVNFGTTAYLGITVDADNNPSTSDPEMVPRTMIVTSFFAKQAERTRTMDVLDVNGVPVAGQSFGWAALMSNGNPNTGTISGARLTASSVPTAALQNNSVTSAKIAANQVGTTHLVDASVTTSKLQDSAVTAAKLQDSAVTAAKLASNSISFAKLGPRPATTGAPGAVGDLVYGNGDSNNSGTSVWTNVSGTVTLNVSGTRPVFVGLVADPTATDSAPAGVRVNTTDSSGANLLLRFVRDGTSLGANQMYTLGGSPANRVLHLPPSAFWTIDPTPQAGARVYTVQVFTSYVSWEVRKIRLVAFEL